MPTEPDRLLYDTAALRAVEQRAAQAHGGDAFELMRRAGSAAWRSLLQHWPDALRIVVVCGPGNNGGDGYVLARHAHEAGRAVRVVRMGAGTPRGELARRACADYVSQGGGIDAFAHALPDADLIVDALFGIGLSRAPNAGAADVIDAINAANAPVFSLDVPSGVDADRGSVPSVAVRATRTLEFIAAHPGLRTGAALEHGGALSLATLDVPQPCFDAVFPVAEALTTASLPRRLPPRRRNAHKGDSGHVLCIGGDHGKGGAILLCAEAALRCGAGLVSVATRAPHVGAALARRPELMACAVDDAHDEAFADMIEKADVIAIGPGLGQDAWGMTLYDAAFASRKPMVLDADALNLLASRPRPLAHDMILTPHPGEAARLLGCSNADVQRDRYAAARALCERCGCVVVLKGAGSVVAASGQRPCVVEAGNPGMAVGGMGDVLTGAIAALRAQKHGAFDAACTGALLHASAGDAAARDGGERGLLPSDLFRHLRMLSNAEVSA